MRMRAIPQKPVDAGHHQSRAHECGDREKPRRSEQTQHRSEECQAACADLHLPLQLNRLTAIGRDGKPRLLPGVETALDDEGLAGATHFLGEPRRMARRARAALAMKDDGLAFVQREVGLVQLGQRQMVRPGDLLPGMLIRLADVDQDGSPMQKTLSFGRADFRKRHD